MQENNKNSFNHLKIHSQYSICEGALKINDLKIYCKENKIKSVGLSDTSNLCGALEFADNISKVGTQPIIGTQINFKYKGTIGLLPLFAKNVNGYKRIIELSSKSYLGRSEITDPHCQFDDLINNSNGIIVLSGSIKCLIGKLFNKGLFHEVDNIINTLSKTFKIIFI